MNPTEFNFPLIENDKLFELFCKDFFNIRYNIKSFELNGRKGQKQYGIDIFGHTNSMEWIGIQCKVRNTKNKLTVKEIEHEIKLAKSFNPSLSQYIIATTEQKDAVLQEKIRFINEEQNSKKEFLIQLLFWNDITDILAETQYKPIIIKYYSDFMIDPLHNGFAPGRFITLILGEIEEYTTKYELFISINPKFNTEKNSSISYFKDNIMIANLQTKGFSLINKNCTPCDLYASITDEWSQILIAKWIRNSNIQEIIYSDEDIYYCSYTQKELNKYLDHENTIS